MKADSLELYCKKCGETTLFEGRAGVPLGTGAAQRRCSECGYLR